MTIDIASLGLRVDSSQVKQGVVSLDELKEAAERTEQSTKKLGDTTEVVAEKGKTAGTKFDGFSRGLRNNLYTLAGVDPRLRALTNLFSGASGAVIGTAASVGVLVKAYVDGAREGDNFARAIAATGNAAGVTTSQLTEMAESIDDVVGTQGKAAQTLALLTSTGKVGADNLERFATVAIEAERTIGTSVEETAKRFADLAEAPTESAQELEKTFHFLTPAIYDYVRAQEKAGNVTGAAAAVQNALADAVERESQRTRGELNLLGRGWQAVADFAKEAWDQMAGIGRKSSLPKQIAELEAARDRALARGFSTTQIDANIEAIKKLSAEQEKSAKAAAEAAAKTRAYVRAQEASAAATEKNQAALKAINAAWDNFDISQVQRGLAKITAQYESFGDELEAQRSANLIGDQEYYDKRRELIEKSTAAEIKAIRDENALLKQRVDNFTPEGIAAQNQIAENEARIAELKTSTASKIKVANIEQTKSENDLANAYIDAQQAADSYVKTLTHRYEIETKGLGAGARERQRLQERADIEAQFEERRQQIERDDRLGRLKEGEKEKLLAIENDALNKSLAAYDDYYAELTEKQGNWLTGFSEALNNFVDDAANVAKSIEGVFTNAFNGMADSLVQFATTGKGGFRSLAESILADLLRIELRIIASQFLQSVFGGFLSSTGSASQQISNARYGGGLGSPGGVTGSGVFGSPASVAPGTQANLAGGMDFGRLVAPSAAPAGGAGAINISSVINMPSGGNRAELEGVLDARDRQLKADIYTNLANGRWPKANK